MCVFNWPTTFASQHSEKGAKTDGQISPSLWGLLYGVAQLIGAPGGPFSVGTRLRGPTPVCSLSQPNCLARLLLLLVVVVVVIVPPPDTTRSRHTNKL